MALVTLEGMPLTLVGSPTRSGHISIVNMSSVLIDLANESCQMIGQIWTSDQQTHTIDTSGQSRLSWRAMNVTMVNVATSVKVGLAAVDTNGGVPPARAVNVGGVVTYSVSRTLGAGAVFANSWNDNVPDTGSMSIAHGDFVCFAVQMVARGGTDAINVGAAAEAALYTGLPYVVMYTPTTYTRSGSMPNAVITFSDGARGYFFGGYTQNGNIITNTYNNTSGTREYGNYFTLPFPCRVVGVGMQANITGPLDIVLYTDPNGTPAQQRALSLTAGHVSISANVSGQYLFSSAYDLDANQPFVLAVKPTSSTNVSISGSQFAVATQQESIPGNSYGVSRGSSGPFAATNTSRDRLTLGPLISAFPHPGRASLILGL